MNFQRLPVVMRPGWDCLYGNHCENAGKPGVNHGIHGDEYKYAVRCELPDGRMGALPLLIFTGRYPSTVPNRVPSIAYPQGASVDLHLQLRSDEAPPEYTSVVDKCEYLGDGRRCSSDGSCLVARDMYATHGKLDGADTVDLYTQGESLWTAMENLLVDWTVGK